MSSDRNGANPKLTWWALSQDPGLDLPGKGYVTGLTQGHPNLCTRGTLGQGSTGILFLKPFLLQGLSKPDLCFYKGGKSHTIC